MTVAVGYGRLHVTLIDVGHGTRRRYGGVGIALAAPKVTVEAAKAARPRALLPPTASVDLVADVDKALSALHRRGLPAEIHVHGSIPAHVGLGSKSATLLAVLQAVHSEYGQPADPAELFLHSGRGGVSGIGVNATSRGGVIVDAGHRQSVDPRFAPSSMTVPQQMPPVNSRISLPQQWSIDLLLPDGPRLRGGRELEVFSRHAPIPREEALSVLAEVYHGILPAISEVDLPALATSIRAVHEHGFKRYELQQQAGSKALLRSIWETPNVAAGMSSMGPLVYVIHDEADEDWTRVRSELLPIHGVSHLMTTTARSKTG